MQAGKNTTRSAGNAKPMMLVFTDGFDIGGMTKEAAANAANNFGVQLYPVVRSRAPEQAGLRAPLQATGLRHQPAMIGWDSLEHSTRVHRRLRGSNRAPSVVVDR